MSISGQLKSTQKTLLSPGGLVAGAFFLTIMKIPSTGTFNVSGTSAGPGPDTHTLELRPNGSLSRRQWLSTMAVVGVAGGLVAATGTGALQTWLGLESDPLQDQPVRRVDMSVVKRAQAFVWQTARSSSSRKQDHLWVFSNPGCVHCLKLEQSLREATDLVVHTVLIPTEPAMSVAKSIWCDSEQSQAWQKFTQGEHPRGNRLCEVPFALNRAISDQLELAYTPAVINAYGLLKYGALDAASLMRHALG